MAMITNIPLALSTWHTVASKTRPKWRNHAGKIRCTRLRAGKREGDGVGFTPREVPVNANASSVHRRTALLAGAAAPCACALCGGAKSANAAGRNPLYDTYFAAAMRYGMDDYEAAIRPVKSQLFGELLHFLAHSQPGAAGSGDPTAAAGALLASGSVGGAVRQALGGLDAEPATATRRVLEIGIGTGPNFPYYTAALESLAATVAAAGWRELPPSEVGPGGGGRAGDAAARPPRLHIVGLDPNREMLRFARESAAAAGLRVMDADNDGSGRSTSGGTSNGSGVGENVGDGGRAAAIEGGDSAAAATSGGAAAAAGPAAALVKVSLAEGSVDSLPYADGEFDAAVVTLVLCSVTSPAAALAELRRVVRPGGRLLLVEHVAAGPGRPGLRLAQQLLTPLQRLMADGCSLNRDTGAAVWAAGWGGQLRQFELEGFSILAPHVAGLVVR